MLFRSLIQQVSQRVGENLNTVEANKLGSYIRGMHPRNMAVVNREMQKQLSTSGFMGSVLGHMTNRDTIYGGGYRGVRRAVGGISDYLGTNSALQQARKNLRGRISQLEKMATRTPEEEAELQSLIARDQAMRDEMFSASRAGTAAMDLTAGIGQYLNSGSWKQRAAKMGTVAGGYMLGATGIRYMSGGDMFHDRNGDFDIAGIPFI